MPRRPRKERGRALPLRASHQGGRRVSETSSAHPATFLQRWEVFRSLTPWLVVALFLALVVAVILGPHKIGDYFTETDFYGDYAVGARQIQHGHFQASRYQVVGPVYELVLGLLGHAIRNPFLAAEWLSAMSALIVLVCWFYLLRSRTTFAIAALALLFCAANPTFFRYSYSATTDMLALAVQATAMYLLVARRSLRSIYSAGVAAGIAILTRYSAAYFLVLGPLVLLVEAPAKRSRVLLPALYVAGALTILGSWVAYVLASHAQLNLQLHHLVAFEVFARAQGLSWDQYERDLQSHFRSLGDVIRYDPWGVLRHAIGNIPAHLCLDATKLLGLPVAISAVAGLGLGLLDRTIKSAWPVVVGAGLVALSLSPIFYSERYALAALPCYCMLAAVPFGSRLLRRPLGGQLRVDAKLLLSALPLALSVRQSISVQREVFDQLPLEVLQCAGELRARVQPGDRIIARKPHIGFLGGAQTVPFPSNVRLWEFADYAKTMGARWLYVSWPEAELRPDCQILLDTSGVVPGLVVRCATQHFPAVLYEITPAFGTRPEWASDSNLLIFHASKARLMLYPNDVRALEGLAWMQLLRREMTGAEVTAEHLARLEAKAIPLMRALQAGDSSAAAGELDGLLHHRIEGPSGAIRDGREPRDGPP